MSGIRGLDQYLTASPYDDEPDWAELGANCPECKSAEADANQVDFESDGSVMLICSECGNDYIFRIGGPSEEQLVEIRKLENELFDISRPKPSITSVYQVFRIAPGRNFTWDDMEAGDWHVYACGDKGCPRQWHKVAYGMNMGQENGLKYLELWSVDEDGNWDFDMGYDEREGDTPMGNAWKEIQEYLNGQSFDYFQGWTKYWLHVARTGDDVLEDLFQTPKDGTVQAAIDAAKDNLKYLSD